MSGFSILSALVLMGAGAYAFFSDVAHSNNNTFSSGNADMQLALDVSNAPGTYGDNITGPSFSGLFPGNSRTFTFWIKNNSSQVLPWPLMRT